MIKKHPLTKETFRFYERDIKIIRHAFPGGSATQLGINEVVRNVLHKWVEETLIPSLKEKDVDIDAITRD